MVGSTPMPPSGRRGPLPARGTENRPESLFNLLNPVLQADTEQKASAYRVEPYVVCADLGSTSPYIRRGGWNLVHRFQPDGCTALAWKAILGFKKKGQHAAHGPGDPAGVGWV